MTLPNMGGYHPVCWGPEWNKTWKKVKFFFIWLLELGRWSSPTLDALGFQAFRLRLESTSSTLWFSGLQTIPACGQKTVGLSLQSHGSAYFIINPFTYMHICYWFCFPELTNIYGLDTLMLITWFWWFYCITSLYVGNSH